MKKTVRTTLYSLLMMALTGCTADQLHPSGAASPLVPITLSTGWAHDGTRAATGIQKGQFDEGETFSVHFSRGSVVLSDGRPLVSTTFTTDGHGTTTPAVQPFFDSSATEAVLYAYYPLSVGSSTTTFSVQQDQTTDEAFKQSDLMTASVTATKSGSSVNAFLQFRHLLSKVIIVATAGEEVTALKSVRLISGQRTIDIADPLECTLGTSLSDALSSSAPLSMYGNTEGVVALSCAAMLPPQAIDGNFIQVDAVGLNGQPTTYTYHVRQLFQAGNEYVIALKVGTAQSRMLITTDLSATPFPYTGQPIEPAVTVTGDDDAVLTEGVHYRLAYSDNVQPGTAIVVAIGIGDYAGAMAKAQFTISAP